VLQFKNSIIVSCQAEENEPLHGSGIMQKMAIAAVEGGASGLRVNTPEDIKAVKQVSDLPIIGLQKDRDDSYEAFITVTEEQIDSLVKAGADIVAIDSTRVSRPVSLEKLYAYVRNNYTSIKVVADISDIEDVKEIIDLKPDFISTTLSGYTPYTLGRPKPDFELIREIKKTTDIPIIAEGNYTSPEMIRRALLLGAYSVVVGGAITRPQQITKRFKEKISDLEHKDIKAIGVDMGGTRTRVGMVNQYGDLIELKEIKNRESSDEKISDMIEMVSSFFSDEVSTVGIASAGRIDEISGEVLYASENLKNWQGLNFKNIIEEKFDLIPSVNNDSNMAAYCQWFFSGMKDIVYITVGTGIGSGIVVNGRLINGITGSGGEIGHLIYPGNDNICTCGKKGCIETILKGNVLLEIENKSGKEKKEAFNNYVNCFAWLLDTLKNTVDFEKVYLGGVIPEYGRVYLEGIRAAFESMNLRNSGDIIEFSTVGKNAGVIGAAIYSLFEK